MKTGVSNKFFLSTVLGFGISIVTVTAASFLQTVNETGSGDWTQAIWGSPASAATAGNSYIVPSGFAVRTVNTGNAQTFAGDSLMVTNGGILYLKHAGGVATVNLILSGGQIIEHGGGTGATYTPLGGTLQIPTDTTAQYSIGSDQASGNHDIWLQSSLSGSGDLVVNMLANLPNTLALYGTNSAYTGNWINDNGTIEIRSGSVNALGSGSVSLTKTTTFLSFNTTDDLVLANSIGGIGSIIKLNTNTVTLNGNNSFTGTTTISNGVLQIGSNSSITNSSLISLAGGTLDVSATGGLEMNSTAGQTMNCNGAIIGNLAASTGNTLNFNLTSATNDILNITGSLILDGNPTINLTLTGFKPGGTYRLINYAGSIQGGGSFNLIPPAGSSEIFSLDISTSGQVNLVVTGSQSTLTWLGDGSANNWDTTSADWTGDATVFAVGDNVIFNDSGSSVPDITITSSSLYPGSMTVSNTSEQYIFDGSLPTTGIITSGALTKMGTNELDFTSSGNNFSGPILIESGILSVGIGGGFGSLGTGPITNNGILRVNMSGNGVAFNSPISGTGSVEITGGGAIVTIGGNGHNSYTGTTTINDGCQLNIATSDALGSTSSGTIVLPNGRLGVASLVDSMTVAEPLTISGTGISGSPGALYVNTTGNNVTWSGPVTIVGDTQIRAVNPNARMNFSNQVLGTNIALECTAGNVATTTDTNTVITFLNTLSLGNSGSLTADGLGIVALYGGSSLCESATVNAGTLLVNGQLTANSVTVNNSSTLGGSGTIIGSVTVQSGGVLAPGNLGIGTLTINGAITLSGTNLMELNRTNSQNADLLTASSINAGGIMTVVNIGPSLQAGDSFQLFSDTINGSFAVTNLPALSSTNLYWDTSLLGNGVIKVASTVPPTPTNSVAHIEGNNFLFQMSPSESGVNYVLQSTPALTSPIVWTSVQTNTGTGGTLNFTNAVNPGIPQQFFRIQAQ